MNTALLPTSHRARLWLAWLPLAIALALNLATLMLRVTVCAPMNQDSNVSDIWGWLPAEISMLGFGVLCGLIVTHQPHNRIGWLCGAIAALATIFVGLLENLLSCAEQAAITLPGHIYLARLSILGSLTITFEFFLLPLWFPDGRFLSAGWRRFAMTFYSILLTIALLLVVWPEEVPLLKHTLGFSSDNPFALPFEPAPVWTLLLQRLFSITFLTGFLLANFSLFARWRRSSGQTRQQLKVVAFFFVTVGSVFMIFELTGQIIFETFNVFYLFNGWLYLILNVLLWVGYPVAIGVSVMKYRLYDIDIVIRRTLVYGGLTATLALVYFGSVLLLQAGLGRLTGVEDSPLAIVISTLLVAALVTPLRRGIQSGIDRRFYRQKYNAEQALAQFALAARSETELEALTARLVGVVNETMQPAQASLWLKRSVEGPQ